MNQALKALQKVLVVVVFAGLCAASVVAMAAEAPDWSGTWKLDTSKSDFGQFPGPDAQTDVWTHKDPKINIKSAVKGGPQGDRNVELNYTTDGSESTNKMGPMDVKTKAKWEGKKLVMHSTADMQGNAITIDATYEVSEDGKTMTVTRNIDSPMGAMTQKMLYTKGE